MQIEITCFQVWVRRVRSVGAKSHLFPKIQNGLLPLAGSYMLQENVLIFSLKLHIFQVQNELKQVKKTV